MGSMNENEIKPAVVDHTVAAHVACESHGERYGIDWIWHHDGIGLLHPQSTIDRLIEQRNNYRAAGDNFEFLANHRARELDRLTVERDAARYDAGTNSSVVATLQQERQCLIAERDALRADAIRYRELIEYALAQYSGRHTGDHNHWAAKAMNELAAIDAAHAKERRE